MNIYETEDKVKAMHNDEYKEANDIFPALKKYKDEHNVNNLKKLCVEIADFCKAVYASTTNEDERTAYRQILSKII
jgi:regulator of sigma D